MEEASKITSKDIMMPATNDNKMSYYSKQSETERLQNTGTATSRKLLSSSNVLEPSLERNRPISRKLQLQQSNLISSEMKRTPSMKSVEEMKFKSEMINRGQGNDLNDNLIKLKTEQMTFKIKTKIGSLLKQMSISIGELNKFTNLGRIDDILSFLSQKVKSRLISTEISENNHVKLLSKEKEMQSEYEIQIDALRKKLQEKEVSQKMLKCKVKDTHNELREMYDRMNQKEKQISAKVTELYQARVLVKQSEKIIDSLQIKCMTLQKERNEFRHAVQDDSRSTMSNIKTIEEQNKNMRDELQEMREELEMTKEKEIRIQQSNSQLSEEVARWRQRFEEVRGTQQHSTALTNALEYQSEGVINQKSLAALEQQNSKLLSKVSTLQQANRQLQRDLLNYASIKTKYEIQERSIDIHQSENGSIELMKEPSVDLRQVETDSHYKKKLELMAKEWKDKLYEVVFNYEDEIETVRQQANRLSKEKEEMEQKLYRLANEKYQVQNRLIEREKQLYQLNKFSKSNNYANNIETFKKEQTKQDLQLQEMLLSAKQIRPYETQPQKDTKQLKQQLQESRHSPTQLLSLPAKSVSDSVILN